MTCDSAGHRGADGHTLAPRVERSAASPSVPSLVETQAAPVHPALHRLRPRQHPRAAAAAALPSAAPAHVDAPSAAIPELESLRGVAIALVFLTHAEGVMTWGHGHHSGMRQE